ncbi:hypothetical protein [Halogeometricum limi]|uniref:Uncharacterized protein n=1 Tax=Halogeometricum limi TaxID=555875 RepID=A0A1I6G1R3_9EURY|nr:hypothetical protein [Halogeometricum limi]SFR36081.1 hypothetical protein SAMN04488124_0721 [Halogeometricum limi]
MDSALRSHLWNRAVLVLFALPALGYLGFLSQFLLGEPTGIVRIFLGGLFLFALPMLILYSTLFGAIAPVNQSLGTVGFFIFTYLFAVALVWIARRGVRLV